MTAALLIAFREGLEAALIVGIVLGYLKKTGQSGYNRHTWMGVGVAIAASIALAAGIQLADAKFEGRNEEIFEGVAMFLAVGVLTWMIFWMRHQSHSIKSSLERDIEQAVGTNQGRGLAALTFLAVFREGVETVLFLSAAAFTNNEMDTLLGGCVGLILAVLLGYLIYISAVQLDLRRFFNVTSALLLLFAAGLFAHGIHEFQEAGLIFIIQEHLWDINHILNEKSNIGEILKALLGYNGNPSLLEVAGYCTYWIATLIGVRWFVERRIDQTTGAKLAV